LLRQGDAKVFKKYSQMKLQMKREALAKLNRQANEGGQVLAQHGRRNSEGDRAPMGQLFWNQQEIWSGRGDLNARPPAPKGLESLPRVPFGFADLLQLQQLGESALAQQANSLVGINASFWHSQEAGGLPN
jgi:hypothetical protein